jgi:hypothetical protein
MFKLTKILHRLAIVRKVSPQSTNGFLLLQECYNKKSANKSCQKYFRTKATTFAVWMSYRPCMHQLLVDEAANGTNTCCGISMKNAEEICTMASLVIVSSEEFGARGARLGHRRVATLSSKPQRANGRGQQHVLTSADLHLGSEVTRTRRPVMSERSIKQLTRPV